MSPIEATRPLSLWILQSSGSLWSQVDPIARLNHEALIEAKRPLSLWIPRRSRSL